MRLVTLILTAFLLSSCYTINPDGSLNIPQRTLADIEGQWVGFNENYFLGMGVNIEKDGTGTLVLSLLEEASESIDVEVSIQNNIVTLSALNNKELTDSFVFELEPSLMLMTIDKKYDAIYIKLSLAKEEIFQNKIRKLKSGNE
jgi:hypothetical protein